MQVSNLLAWAIAAIFVVFAAIVLYRISKADLSGLICEVSGAGAGKASLSRFQFLLFTFVVAGIYVTLCLKTNSFVNIPGGALGLIGISGGSYAVSKAIK